MIAAVSKILENYVPQRVGEKEKILGPTFTTIHPQQSYSSHTHRQARRARLLDQAAGWCVHAVTNAFATLIAGRPRLVFVPHATKTKPVTKPETSE